MVLQTLLEMSSFADSSVLLDCEYETNSDLFFGGGTSVLICTDHCSALIQED